MHKYILFYMGGTNPSNGKQTFHVGDYIPCPGYLNELDEGTLLTFGPEGKMQPATEKTLPHLIIGKITQYMRVG